VKIRNTVKKKELDKVQKPRTSKNITKVSVKKPRVKHRAKRKPIVKPSGKPRGRPKKVISVTQTTLDEVKIPEPKLKAVPVPEPKAIVVSEPKLNAVPVTPEPVQIQRPGQGPIRINLPCKTCKYRDRHIAYDMRPNSGEAPWCNKKKQFCALCFDVKDFPNPKCDMYEKKEQT
jgi:hypothetical protein